MTLTELQKASYQHAKEKGFIDLNRTVGEDLMLMVSELAEALEEYRAGHYRSHIYYSNLCTCYKDLEADVVSIASNQACSNCGKTPKPEGIPVELADCVIRIAQAAESYGFDLDAVIKEKMAYNSTRPALHGGKRL